MHKSNPDLEKLMQHNGMYMGFKAKKTLGINIVLLRKFSNLG